MELNEISAKVLLLGSSGSGKTWLLHRFVHQETPVNIKSTVGFECKSRKVRIRENLVEMLFWDTSGQEDYIKLATTAIREPDAVIVLFDLTDLRSYTSMQFYITEMLELHQNIPIYVVGNKHDLPNRQIASDKVKGFCRVIGAPYYETSALTGYSVDDLFDLVSRDIIMKPKNINTSLTITSQTQPDTSVTYDSTSIPPVKKSKEKCC